MRDTTGQMNIRTGRHRSAIRRTRMRGVVAVAALAAGAASLPILAGAATAAPAAKATVIATATTPFGTALVVGSGKFAGYSLYMITSDHGTRFGCTAQSVKTPVGPFVCTGTSGDQNAEWPAITTTGAPIAGPGVSKKLLGMVKRSFGEQVTYAGHPLYLFDSMAGAVTGEGWDEPSLPPWHGVWTLVAPSGQALPWVGTLSTMKIGNRTVLATQMSTGIGTINFPVYSYSKDTGVHSACSGLCAVNWPPVLTSGTPGVTSGLLEANVGTLHSSTGTQVSYMGKPLYLFGFEAIGKTASGLGATGNGNGISVDGGTFRLVNA